MNSQKLNLAVGTPKKKKYSFVYYLKAVAALLIVNSHFDTLYPISALATGGAIGNAIFFAISGFLLYPITASDFKSWMKKRTIRIYVPVWTVTAVMLLIGSNEISSFSNAILTFIWPTNFWFAGGIIIFYMLYYVLKDVTSKKDFARFGVIALILYFAYYLLVLDTSTWVVEWYIFLCKEGVFKLIYYFTAMMIGKYFAIYSSELSGGGTQLCDKRNTCLHFNIWSQAAYE